MKTKQLLFFVLLVLIFYRCANQGYPEGGAKDTTPPLVTKSTPQEASVNFKGDEITITFDELIKLEGMDEKFVCSPPLQKKPSISARGRSLLVRLNEPLQENTTYTMDFADGILDYNEGNVLNDFKLSFATGTEIDSFAISGNVYDAKTLSPVEGVMVLLYKNLNDSAFSTVVPLRLGKTDKNGHFSIHNIAMGDYRIYALKDANRNYIFDQPSEEIGWNRVVFQPSIETVNAVDSMLHVVVGKNDSIKVDTVVFRSHKNYLPNDLKLFLYQQDYEVLYFKGDARKQRDKINLFFNKAVSGLDVILVSDSTRQLNSWAMRENSVNRDTVSLWITDSLISKMDTLALSVKYLTKDSLNNPYYKTDSIISFYFELEKGKKRSKKNEPVVVPSLEFQAMPSLLDIYASYPIELATPATTINKKGVKLIQEVDTIRQPIVFDFATDSVKANRYFIKAKWEFGKAYYLAIDSASFINSVNLANKALVKKFEIKPESSYGLLLVTIENGVPNSIVQLVDEKDNVIRQQNLPKSGKMAFQFLKPGDYFVKIVEDENRNKRWDVGDFSKGVLPETVVYYPEKLTIRSNWRHEVKWDRNTFSIETFVKQNRVPKSNK